MPTDYLVTDTELTSVADAIRTKGETNLPLEFPTEFVTAIAAIPTGGGLPANIGHFSFTPAQNLTRVDITVGDGVDVTDAVFVSNFGRSAAREVSAAILGEIHFSTAGSGAYGNYTRVISMLTSGSLDYWTGTSSGSTFSFSGGVLSIGNTSKWLFASGVQYDVFYNMEATV